MLKSLFNKCKEIVLAVIGLAVLYGVWRLFDIWWKNRN